MMASSNAASCCARITSVHPEIPVAFPNSTAYTIAQKSYWSLQESSLTPGCIVSPRSAQDVADVVTTLTSSVSFSPADEWKHRNGTPSCQFAVKAHGHAPAAGFANIASPGLTIDLTSLSTVALSEDHAIASVGAGASWLEVYSALDPFGKSVAGGRNGAVGVGGLTLGGGISYFSPLVGFTCDTVANFEVVLASGALVNANATSRQDLFKALKGGGNNLGIVTRFDFRTVNISQISAGSIVHPATLASRTAVFHAFADLANTPDYDVHASLVTGLIFNSTAKQWILQSTPVYTLPVLHPPAFAELFSAPAVTSKVQLTNLSVLANENATPPLDWAFRTGTYGASAAFLETFFQICNASLYDFSLPGGGLLLWSIALEPLPSIFLSRGAGSNVLGTSAQDGDGMIVLISPLWTALNASASVLVQAKADEILSKVNAAAESAGVLKRFVYANYAGATQAPYHSYGQENEEFLYRTAKMYDPHGVFQRQVPGGFKLQH